MRSSHGTAGLGISLFVVCFWGPGATPAAELSEICKALLAPEARNPPSADFKQLQECGNAAQAGNDYAGAVRAFELAIRAAERSRDNVGVARARHAAGKARLILGDLAKAEPLLLGAVNGFEALGLKPSVASAMLDLARLRSAQSRYRETIELAEQSLRLYEEMGDQRGIGGSLTNIGLGYFYLNDTMRALEYMERSMKVKESAGDSSLASTLSILGSIYHRVGDYDRAIDFLNRALALSEAAGDRLQIARASHMLGRIYRLQGSYAVALEYMQRSWELRSAMKVVSEMSSSLVEMAALYQDQGNYDQAVHYLQTALDLGRKSGAPARIANAYTSLGEAYAVQGKLDIAEQYFEQGLKASQESGFKAEFSVGWLGLGRIYAQKGKLDEATRSFALALAAKEARHDYTGVSEITAEMAVLELRRGNVERGLEFAARSVAAARQIGAQDAEWYALTVTGRLERAAGRPHKARESFDRAISLIEQIRTQVAGGEDDRSRFLSARVEPYHERIALALAEAKPEEAFHLAERAKSRALLDTIGADRRPLSKSMTEEERQKERRLHNTLASLNNQLSAGKQEPAALLDRRDRARLEYEDFKSKLYASHPGLRAWRGEIPAVTASEAARLLPGSTAALLEFQVDTTRARLFVITSSGLKVYELKVSAAELAKQVEEFRTRLAGRDLTAAEGARRLYDEVLGPARVALRNKTELIIVPDGILWDLPFQALQPGPKRYLIEDYALSYVPSLTVLRETRRNRPRTDGYRGDLLAFGNPTRPGLDPLPQSEAQVRRLAEIYGASSRVYIGADAQEERLKSEAQGFRILHLATHGVVDDRSPLYSRLVLATAPRSKEDGLLEAWEIMQLDLKANLVALSACETARGQVSAGEGVIGLMWAFFVAGSPATLVSQWKVDAASSTELMVEFHRRWRGGASGVSKARALREAAIELLRKPESSHPFYWAGYIMVGNAL